MKILHIQKAAGLGGSERHLLDLLSGLHQRGYHVRMLVLEAPNADRMIDALKAREIETVTMPAGRDISPPLVAGVLKQVRDFGPDLVHTHLVHADLYGQLAALLSHTPSVRTVHGTYDLWGGTVRREVALLSSRIPGRTIAISRYLEELILRHRLARSGTVRMVPHGIDVQVWRLSTAERARHRASLGIDPEHVVVGIASRLVAMKGHDVLIDAMRLALVSAPNIRLLVAGDGSLRGVLEESERGLPRGIVRFLGHLPDVRWFMSVCDMLAVPTLPGLGEGFGLTALEAMAAGLPVVASAVGALPEVVANGETGVIVPPGDVDALAAALLRLVREPEFRRYMGAAGHRRASSVFPIDAMITGTSAVYEELV